MNDYLYNLAITEIVKKLEARSCHVTENRYATIVNNGFEDVVFPKFRIGTIEFYFCKYQKIIKVFRHRTKYKNNLKEEFIQVYNSRFAKIIKQ